MKNDLSNRDYRNNVPRREAQPPQPGETAPGTSQAEPYASDAREGTVAQPAAQLPVAEPDAGAQQAAYASPDAQRVPYTLPNQGGSQGSYPPPGTPSSASVSPAPKKQHTVLKVLALLGMGCMALSLASVLLVGSALTVGIASCAAAFSDDPIGDTKEAEAFIKDLATNERDLATFDALEGAITSLYQRRASYVDDSQHMLDPAALRAAIAAGTWPKDPEGYGDVGSNFSPQLWVRLAELSQDYLEQETGEQWEVCDFCYPFPDSGPVPVPATRGEHSCTNTWLRCTQGSDKGLVVTVNYYRWRQPAVFESTLDDARTRYEKAKELYGQFAALEALGGRRYLFGDGDLYIWSSGANDPLRDPEAFADLVNEVNGLVGPYAHVSLLVEDAPAAVNYDTLSNDYPNERPEELLPFEEAKDRLMREYPLLRPATAAGDTLLEGYRSQDEDCTAESLTGTLAPTPEESYDAPWRPPKPNDEDESIFDEGLAEVAARTLTGIDTSEVIAVKRLGLTGTSSDDYDLWVIVPRGAVPETQDEFCAAAYGLLDAAWDYYQPSVGDNPNMQVRLYVIDTESIRDEQGNPVTFAQMREAAQADPTALGSYTFEVLLSGWPFTSSWDGERRNQYCEPKDVGGTIARSRAWRFEDAVDKR